MCNKNVTLIDFSYFLCYSSLYLISAKDAKSNNVGSIWVKGTYAKGAYTKGIYIKATCTGSTYSRSTCIKGVYIGVIIIKGAYCFGNVYIRSNCDVDAIKHWKIYLQLFQILEVRPYSTSWWLLIVVLSSKYGFINIPLYFETRIKVDW